MSSSVTTRSGVQISLYATSRTPQWAYAQACYFILAFLGIPLSLICSTWAAKVARILGASLKSRINSSTIFGVRN